MKLFSSLSSGNKVKPFVVLGFVFLSICNNASAEDSSSLCQQNALQKSQSFIRFILDDLSRTYTQVGGGGISNIKQTATNTFRVSISQEERIDQISYELQFMKGCEIDLIDRKSTAVSPWNRPHWNTVNPICEHGADMPWEDWSLLSQIGTVLWYWTGAYWANKLKGARPSSFTCVFWELKTGRWRSPF